MADCYTCNESSRPILVLVAKGRHICLECLRTAYARFCDQREFAL